MVNNEKALSKIRALLKSEGIDFSDVDSAVKSLSETCLPTKLTRIYLEEIQNDSRKASQRAGGKKPPAAF